MPICCCWILQVYMKMRWTTILHRLEIPDYHITSITHNGSNAMLKDMEMRLEYLGSTLVAKLNGELDQSCAAEIREKIDNEISLHGMSNLVMDFDNVPFMDSSGIGMLIGRYKQIKARGGKMLVIRTQPQVDKVIELAGLKKIMDFD